MRLAFFVFFLSVSTSAVSNDFEMAIKPSQSTQITTQSNQSMENLTVPLLTIDRQQIKDSMHQPTTELLESQSHATVVRCGGRFQPAQIFIRGASSDHSLVIVDGVEVNDPMHPGRGSNLSLLPSQNLEKIEILPTAYSILYGSDAMGGIVNVTSEKFSDLRERSVSLEFGRYTFSSIKLYSNSKYLQHGLEVSADEGYSAKAPRDGEADGHSFGTGFVKARHNIGKAELTAYFRLSSVKNELDNGTGPLDDDSNHTSKNYNAIGSLSADYAWYENFSTTVSYQHSYHLRKTKNPEDEDHPGATFKSVFSGNISKAKLLNHWKGHIHSLMPVQLHFGGEWEYENGYSRMEDVLFGNSSFPRKNQTSLAGFALSEVQFYWTTLFMGYRVDKHSEFETQGNYNLGLSQHITKEVLPLRILANVASGFKAPSLFQRFSDFGNRHLLPEESRSITAGLEMSPLPELKLTVNYFRNNFSELIDFDFATNKYINLHKVDLRGWEGGLKLVRNEWRSDLLYARLTHQDSSGQALLRRPRDKVSLSIAHDVNNRLTLGVKARHLGKRRDVNATGQSVMARAYTVADLQSQYRLLQNLNVFARIENVLNHQYQEVYGYATTGRALFAGVDFTL